MITNKIEALTLTAESHSSSSINIFDVQILVVYSKGQTSTGSKFEAPLV